MKFTQVKTERFSRIPLLDALRGAGILFVLWYHLMLDLNIAYGICGFIRQTWMGDLRNAVVMLFVFLSGLCCRFSQDNFRRGVRCFLAAVGVTAVTGLMDPERYIRFGVLHMLGLSMMLYGWVFWDRKMKQSKTTAICLILFFLIGFQIPQHAIGFYRAACAEVPTFFYQTPVLYWLGFPDRNFVSMDYVPMLPWGLLFFAGAAWKTDFSFALKYRGFPGMPLLSFCGKHSLLLYLLHQPVYWILLWAAGAGA